MKSMRLLTLAILSEVFGLTLHRGALADSADSSQTVNFGIGEIALVQVANAQTLLVPVTRAGDAIPDATTARARWSITSNRSQGKKLTAELKVDMAPDTTLTVEVEAPPTGQSKGPRALNTLATGKPLGPVDVVTGILPVVATGKRIAYTLHTKLTAGVIPSSSVVVNFTLVDDD